MRHIRKGNLVLVKDFLENETFTLPIGLKKVLWLKNEKNRVVITSDLNEEEIVGRFCKNNDKRQSQHSLQLEKLNSDKLYADWKGYDNLFSS